MQDAFLNCGPERTWSQVALLTRGTRDPASPSSPFTSFKLGYDSGFQALTQAKQFACFRLTIQKPTAKGGFSNGGAAIFDELPVLRPVVQRENFPV